jgi:hypothetical protein
MGRPRVQHGHLPTRMSLECGTYYYRGKDRVRVALSRDFDEAMGLYAPLALRDGIAFVPPNAARLLFLRAKRNAARRRVEFGISESYVRHLLEICGARCSVSGLKLNVTFDGTWSRNPWAPSIDRIDAKRGYVEGNCRVVCVAANVALNEWGLDVLTLLVDGISQFGKKRA